MNYSVIRQQVQRILDPIRFQHSEGVEEVAVRLAERYDIEVSSIRIAAILHDCAKNLSKYHLLQRLATSDIVIGDVDDMEKEIVPLLHAPVGAIIAQEDYGVTDVRILKAIRYHTTGAPDLTLFSKIIFLADYIEPNRVCPGIDDVRNLAFQDIDQAVAMAAGRTMVYEINRDNPIHLRTVQMRNALIRRGEKNE